MLKLIKNTLIIHDCKLDVIIFTFFLLCILQNAQAQIFNKDTTNNLSPVSVYYNRWKRKINEVPNRITKFYFKQQRLQNPQTMADAIGVTGKVFIQKSQMGGGSPMIRGFATNRVLMVVDGVRMNNAIYRSGNLQNIISFDPLAGKYAVVDHPIAFFFDPFSS